MRKHVQILGWLYIAMGMFGLLGGMLAFGVLAGFGLLSGDPMGFGVMATIGGIAGFVLFAVSLPNLIVGMGLLRNWGGWVIILAVVVAIFNLASFPLGTALGIYTFWVAYRLSAATESFG
jgi:hypothetical protein